MDDVDVDAWALRTRGGLGWSWRVRSPTSPTGYHHSTASYASRDAALAAARQWLDQQVGQ